MLFSISSPLGILLGLILTSLKLEYLDNKVTPFLTAISAGTFIYITFFEMLGKDLKGTTLRDYMNFLICLLGFGIFAGIYAIAALRI